MRLVEVRVNWPGHPRLSKKKKKQSFLIIFPNHLVIIIPPDQIPSQPREKSPNDVQLPIIKVPSEVRGPMSHSSYVILKIHHPSLLEDRPSIQRRERQAQRPLPTPFVRLELYSSTITHFKGGSIKEKITSLPNSSPNTDSISTSHFTRVSAHSFLPILPLDNLLSKDIPIKDISPTSLTKKGPIQERETSNSQRPLSPFFSSLCKQSTN